MKYITLTLTAMSSFALSHSALADSVFVDFFNASDADTAATGTNNTGTETYNIVALTGTTSANRPWVLTGETFTDLTNTDGSAGSIDLLLNTYNTDDGQRRGGSANNGNNFTHVHVDGINDNAAGDALWMNNHNSNTGDFGWVLTFTDLDDSILYDFTVLATSGNNAGSWSVTTGTGDTDNENYGIDRDNVLSWTNVASDGGTVVLTGAATATADISGNTFRNAGIAFASVTAVPEPSSTALLGLGGLALLMRRRK